MPAEVLMPCHQTEPLLRTLKQSGHVGFDSLPHQLVDKSVENGFVFNIMCIGETGLGKSTLMDTLFNTNFESTPCPHTLPNVQLQECSYQLKEGNVNLKLNICNTVGYGDQINKDDSFQSVVNHINSQYEIFLQEELKIERTMSSCHDNRIHACLYFICPTGHGLKALDLMCMKQIDSKVNVIPVIAKADTISKTELERFKKKIMQELREHDVKIYQFPTHDEAVAKVNLAMNEHVPFAVVGSTDFMQVGNKLLRVRQYPWGTVHVENEAHCDFIKLREMLIRTNMEDLREQTHSRHYEMYRQNRLREMGFCDVDAERKPVTFQETLRSKLEMHLKELQTKEEQVREVFVQRVKEKENELKECEKDLHAKFEKLKRDHTDEKQKFEDLRKELEDDWVELNRRKAQIAASSSPTLTMGKSKKN